MMQRLITALLAMVWVSSTWADRVELNGDSALIGEILAEKPDHVVLDIGYTVMMIPRSQIVRIAMEAGTPADTVSETPLVAGAESGSTGFYRGEGSSGRTRSVRELVRLLGQAVVQVRTPGGLGSGFLINEDGFLITNFHVIEGETQISVEVYWQKNGDLERKTYKEVKIIAMNKFKDLALLQIVDADAPTFSYVPLAPPNSLDVGERVFAIGSPLGLERTVTEGIVSTSTREMMGELYLQTTAQINPGNSGGPLFNLKGEVVGVTNMKMQSGEGLGFAIPVEALRFFLDHRDAYAYSADNPSNPYRYLEPPNRTRDAPSLTD